MILKEENTRKERSLFKREMHSFLSLSFPMQAIFLTLTHLWPLVALITLRVKIWNDTMHNYNDEAIYMACRSMHNEFLHSYPFNTLHFEECEKGQCTLNLKSNWCDTTKEQNQCLCFDCSAVKYATTIQSAIKSTMYFQLPMSELL